MPRLYSAEVGGGGGGTQFQWKEGDCGGLWATSDALGGSHWHLPVRSWTKYARPLPGSSFFHQPSPMGTHVPAGAGAGAEAGTGTGTGAGATNAGAAYAAGAGSAGTSA